MFPLGNEVVFNKEYEIGLLYIVQGEAKYISQHNSFLSGLESEVSATEIAVMLIMMGDTIFL